MIPSVRTSQGLSSPAIMKGTGGSDSGYHGPLPDNDVNCEKSRSRMKDGKENRENV